MNYLKLHLSSNQRKKTKKRTPKRKINEDINSCSNSDSEIELRRPRTPSGQVLTVSVGSIKSLLQAKGCNFNFNTNTTPINEQDHDENCVGATSANTVLSGCNQAETQALSDYQSNQPCQNKHLEHDNCDHHDGAHGSPKRLKTDMKEMSNVGKPIDNYQSNPQKMKKQPNCSNRSNCNNFD